MLKCTKQRKAAHRQKKRNVQSEQGRKISGRRAKRQPVPVHRGLLAGAAAASRVHNKCRIIYHGLSPNRSIELIVQNYPLKPGTS